MKYWEKTVEYAFLAHATQKDKIDFAAPLSGKLECGAGDAMFAQGSRYLLVEFKTEESGMTDERRKFLDYDVAHKTLATRDHHHFFVYGCLSGVRFELHATRYFSRKPPQNAGCVLSCLADGAEKEVFDDYLREFLRHRKRDERGDGVDVSDYASVIGVAPDRSASACSLRDYAGHFAPGYVSSYEPEPTSPRRGPR